MKAFRALIKPFEVPQRSVKIKFHLIFSLRQALGREGLNYFHAATLFFTIKGISFNIVKQYEETIIPQIAVS